MKRFYKEVRVKEGKDGFGVLLDGRPIRTPGKRPFLLPTSDLGEAIAEEWRAQKDEIRPASMPLTQIANAAIDQTMQQRDETERVILAYAESDLICYRAETPLALLERQKNAWDPIVEWVASTIDARFNVTPGLMPCAQNPETLDAFARVVRGMKVWPLTALGVATNALGSLALGLALLHRRITAAEALAASNVDEDFQMERWGEDAEALERRRGIAADVHAARIFSDLSQR